jgi:dTDP-4-dehydrorhamnose 3,5-epimerase
VIFREMELAGAYTVDPECFEDERGFFARIWSEQEFREHGLTTVVSQSSIAYNWAPGTLRGMHWQVEPFAETKLIRCTRGALHDVIVDLRPDSSTFGLWTAIELTADSRRMLYLPQGFAHGYLTLEPDTEVWYQMSAKYLPEAARGFQWNDPRFGIRWPAEPKVVSEQDSSWPDFTEDGLRPLLAQAGDGPASDG